MARGTRKFRLLESWLADDGLQWGRIEVLEDERPIGVEDDYADLVTLLRELAQHPLVAKLKLSIDFEDAGSVSYRLAELLPIEPEIKQSLLQLTSPRERLAELDRLVRKLRS